MRCFVLGGALLLSVFARGSAQEARSDSARPSRQAESGGVPERVALEVVAFYNDRSTQRVQGRFTVAQGDTLTHRLAVLDGDTLVIGGRVRGNVVAINTAVLFLPTGRIEGDLLVVGAETYGRTDASVRGDVRVYRDSLQAHLQDGRLRVVGVEEGRSGSWIAARARAYNRVEGLPIEIGPTYEGRMGDQITRVEVRGIIRSADRFDWVPENLGHVLRFEQRRGEYQGIALGGTLFDVVEPVEAWQLRDLEAGLAAFVLHRDYRDYYERHGGALFARVYSGSDIDFTLTYSDASWRSRETRDPWTLFRGGQTWRPNPPMEDGRVHALGGALRFDTRDDEDNPSSGWWVQMDVERGTAHLAFAESPSLVRHSEYARAFVDVVRYNRISPHARLNVRLVWGGQLPGDALPLQRRLSVSGPGTLPGFDFRKDFGGADVGLCVASAELGTAPASCQRVALAQVEYRGKILLDLFGAKKSRDEDWRGVGRDDSAEWVVFADAGRGWLIGPGGDGMRYGYTTMAPPFGTFRTDVGVGLDLGGIGLYVAKAVSHSKEPTNFFVRLRHRF